MSFSVKQGGNKIEVAFFLLGYVNELASFPSIPIEAKKISIDLKGVIGLNSIGTRSWCHWIASMPKSSAVTLDNCPVIFVKGFNQVVGMLAANIQVLSFFVPFVAPSDGSRTDILIRHDQVSPDGKVHIPECKNDRGEILEMDVLESYFGFLKP